MTVPVQNLMKIAQQKTIVSSIAIGKLLPSKYQTRHEAFEDVSAIQDLAASISSIGLIELPLVKNSPDHLGYYEIISGHRRIKAVTEVLQWEEVECVVYRDLDDVTTLKLVMTDNIQRSDLSEFEEGTAYLLCQRNFGFSDSKIAELLNKPRGTVSSKKTFAIQVSKYKRFLNDADFEKFIRNVTHRHLELLEDISNDSLIERAIEVAKNSPDVNELRALLANSDVKNHDKVENDSKVRHRPRNEKDQLLIQLVAEISRLREHAPDEIRAQIYLLQDIADNLRSKYHLHSAVEEETIRHRVADVKEFTCPRCGEQLQIEKRVDDQAKTIAFVLGLKDSKYTEDKVQLAFTST